MSHRFEKTYKSKDMFEVIELSDDESGNENKDPAPSVAVERTPNVFKDAGEKKIAPLGAQPTTTPPSIQPTLDQVLDRLVAESRAMEKELQSKKVPVLKSVGTENGDPAEEILKVIAVLCLDGNLGPYIEQHLIDFEEEKRRGLGGNPSLKLNYTQIVRIWDFYLYNIAHGSSENGELTLNAVYEALKRALDVAGPILQQRLMEFLEKQLGFSKKLDKKVPVEAVLWNLQQIIQWLYYEGGEEIRSKNLSKRFKPY